MSVAARRALPVLLAIALVSPNVRAAAAATVDLTPHVAANEFAQVNVELEVGGTMSVRDGAGEEAQERTLPMSLSAQLNYDEQRVPPNRGNFATRAIRYYNQAEAVIKVDNDGKTPKLADDSRLIVAQNSGGRIAFCTPRGLLEREEIDLIDVTADSLTIDGLLPTEPVGPDAAWPADPNAVAALLSMDNIAACEVQSVLDKFNQDFALVRVAGSVVGTADGAPTEMEVRGVYLFDRKLGRVTRFNLAVKEKRSIGGATPGLDAVAKIRVNVKPLDASANLSQATLAALRNNNKLQLDVLQLDAAAQGYRLCHDRRWYLTRQERQSTTLRCVDRGDTLATCTISSLSPKSAGHHTTLEEFERDIRFALKENFGQLVASRQWTNAFKHHCLEVAVRGTVDQVPVEWHFYLVAPETGNRVSIAVTIDGQMVERLGSADRTLVNAIELVPAMSATETAAQTETRR